MVYLRHRTSTTDTVNVFESRRLGRYILLDGIVQLGSAKPVELFALCCRPSERHIYPSHVHALSRMDGSTWRVESGPHFVQLADHSRPVSVIVDAIQLIGVPEGLDLFA